MNQNNKLEQIVSDLVQRIPEMAKASPMNNEELLKSLLAPLASVPALVEGQALEFRPSQPDLLVTPEFYLGQMVAIILGVKPLLPEQQASPAATEEHRKQCVAAISRARQVLEIMRKNYQRRHR